MESMKIKPLTGKQKRSLRARLLVKFYQELAQLTAPKCRSGCAVGWSCCDSSYCYAAEEHARYWGVKLVKTANSQVPFLGRHGCVVSPHLRPMCTMHVCSINGLGFDPDPIFTRRYFALRDIINTLEYYLMHHNQNNAGNNTNTRGAHIKSLSALNVDELQTLGFEVRLTHFRNYSIDTSALEKLKPQLLTRHEALTKPHYLPTVELTCQRIKQSNAHSTRLLPNPDQCGGRTEVRLRINLDGQDLEFAGCAVCSQTDAFIKRVGRGKAIRRALDQIDQKTWDRIVATAGEQSAREAASAAPAVVTSPAPPTAPVAKPAEVVG